VLLCGENSLLIRYKLISPTGTNDKIKEAPSMCAMDKGDLANKKGM